MQDLWNNSSDPIQESPRPSNEYTFTRNTTPAEDGQTKEIVFIDSTIEDDRSVAAAVAGATEVIILDQIGDEIEQITQALTTHANIHSVHIVSHDEEGGVSALLGSDPEGNPITARFELLYANYPR